jgi:hypothetical protein
VQQWTCSIPLTVRAQDSGEYPPACVVSSVLRNRNAVVPQGDQSSHETSTQATRGCRQRTTSRADFRTIACSNDRQAHESLPMRRARSWVKPRPTTAFGIRVLDMAGVRDCAVDLARSRRLRLQLLDSGGTHGRSRLGEFGDCRCRRTTSQQLRRVLQGVDHLATMNIVAAILHSVADRPGTAYLGSQVSTPRRASTASVQFACRRRLDVPLAIANGIALSGHCYLGRVAWVGSSTTAVAEAADCTA